MLGFPLFDREDSSAEVSELSKFLLDCLEPLLSLSMGDLGLYFVAAPTPRTSILGVRFYKLFDLIAETLDLFAQHVHVIHKTRIAYL